MTHRNRNFVALLFTLLVGAAAFAPCRAALASDVFPPAVADHMGLPCVPTCDVCHLTNAGGPGNLNDSGLNLLFSGGIVRADTSTVGPALDAVSMLELTNPAGLMYSADIDGNGITNVEQIRQGLNPVSGEPLCSGNQVEYGCVGRIAPKAKQADSDAAGAMAAAALVALLIASRRR